MSDAILDFPASSEPANAGRKLVQLWISADLASVVDRFRDREPDSPSRSEAIRRLIHLGLADDALYRRKRRGKI